MRRRPRKDANHAGLVRYARAIGFTVLDVASVPRALDLVLGLAGVDQRAEIKDPAKPPSARQLTPHELDTMLTWAGRPPVVLETEADLDALRAAILAERQETTR